MKMNLVVPALALLGWVSALAFAQTPTAQISGRIADASGASVPGVQVTVMNVGTNLRQQSVSNEQGYYTVVALHPGSYQVSVQHDGFRPIIQPGITLTVAQSLQLHFTLEVGTVDQTITVEATVPQVDTDSSTVGMVVDDRRIRDLPLNGRNAVDLAALVPGVSSMETSQVTSFQQQRLFLNGGRANSLNFVLDGGSINFTHRGHGLGMPNPDALQEFTLNTTGVPAEYGRGFAVLSAVTRSGTNEFHGSLFNFLRNDAMDARSFFAAGVPKLRYNQFGGTLGGPVIRSRTFFFGSYQGLRIRNDQLSSNSFPPGEAERQGNFAGAAPVRDPLTGQPFPENVIPNSRFDTVSRNLLQTYVPAANRPGGQFVTQVSRPSDTNQVLARVDHVVSDANRLNVRYFLDRAVALNNFAAGSSFPDYTPQANEQRQQVLTLEDTHTFTPTLLNTVRLNYTRFNYEEANRNRNTLVEYGGTDFIHAGGIPTAPQIAVTGRFTLATARDRQRLSDNFDFSQNMTWIHGRHQVKWGIDVQRNRFLYRDNRDTGGLFDFDGSRTGNPFADFLLGTAVRMRQAAPLETEQTYYNTGLFIQDNFKVNSRLTLNLGLRFESFPRWNEKNGLMASYAGGAQSSFIPSAPPGLVYLNDGDAYPYQDNNFNLAPRFGLAWDVFGTGRTSVRASYGISYDPLTAEMAGGVELSQPFGITHIVNSPPALSAPYRNLLNPFPYTPDLANPTFILPMTIPKSFDPNVTNPYVQNYSFGIQQQLLPDLMLDVSYVGNAGRKLGYQNDLNPAVYGPGATTGNTDSRRPLFPHFGQITQFVSGANSSYNSLQVKVNKRFSRDITFAVAYTYAKAIEDARSQQTFQGGGGHIQDPFNLRADRAAGDTDLRHRFVSSYLYALPFFRQPGMLSTLFGGWELGGILTLQTGTPVRIVSGPDNSLTGVRNDRPNLVGNPFLSASRSRAELVSRWFDPTAFVQNPAGTYGNAGRNILRGPGVINWDVSVSKAFPMFLEGHRLHLRGEAFNVMNRPNFGDPNATLNSPAVGRITSAADGRIMQVALRYTF